mmetsp:Transcript_26822/g.58926  ORF Transcript_26822/g.58926 Transcript_26822/m.58926 type:complete len:124 (-) Transcript_26822:1007-1378(-)|eukprot:4695328-Pleurochrysis_carterae.AAC.1
MKRPRELAAQYHASLRANVLQLVEEVTGRDMEALKINLNSPLHSQPSPTLLDLGVTSAQAALLRACIFKQLMADVNTFDLLKTPFSEMVLLVGAAQSKQVGAVLPPLGSAQAQDVASLVSADS